MFTFTEEDKNFYRRRRLTALLGCWSKFTFANNESFILSPVLIEEVVEHYIQDLEVLKHRYVINEKAQLHKVAGLMTASIVRFRPILPMFSKCNAFMHIYANELFAVLHGVSLCAGDTYSEEETHEIMNRPLVKNWTKNTLYLLHRRNFTSESLANIYEAFSLCHFPKNLQVNCEGE